MTTDLNDLANLDLYAVRLLRELIVQDEDLLPDWKAVILDIISDELTDINLDELDHLINEGDTCSD